MRWQKPKGICQDLAVDLKQNHKGTRPPCMAMRAHGLVGPWHRFVSHHRELGRAGLGKRRRSAETRAWAAAACWPVDPAARRGRAAPVIVRLTGGCTTSPLRRGSRDRLEPWAPASPGGTGRRGDEPWLQPLPNFFFISSY